MKNQKSAQLVKSSNEIVPNKSAATPSAESGEIVKFDEAGMPQLEVWLENETIWLTQAQLSELFGVKLNTINYHIKSILKSGDLQAEATIRKIRIVQIEGDRRVARPVDFHNLDMIISLGYRVNSAKATKFRIWATGILKEYIKKGFVLDDERLKQGNAVFGKDYFKELLERVRSIRASERRIWQQITDIFAECSIDYDKDSEITKRFFATVQNKFHYAITGQTAAEIVYERADHKKEHMGLTTWKNSPSGRVLKSDVNIAKNYLSEKQIRQLERAVSGYFDYIEDLIEREIAFNMEQFAASVNEFLEFRRYDILDGNGKVSRDQADEKAFGEYEIFNRTQKIDSDFDKVIRKIKKN